MNLPIFIPVSISIIEKMEITFDISEGTYIKEKEAKGKLYITPLLGKFENLREAAKKGKYSTTYSNPNTLDAKKELGTLKHPTYVQYKFGVDPPKPFLDRLISGKSASNKNQQVSLGFLLLGGIETVNFLDDPPELTKGVFEIILDQSRSRKLITELSKDRTREIEQEFPYEINLDKIKKLVEEHPEIKRSLFAISKKYEIREPLSIKISIQDWADVMSQLNGKGPKTEIQQRLLEKEIYLKNSGKSGIDLERELSVFRMKIEEEVRQRLRRNEKFFGKIAIEVCLENISEFPIKGDIFIEEVSLNFPISFSEYEDFSDYYDSKSKINFRYDPVKMKAIWRNFLLSRKSDTFDSTDSSDNETQSERTLFLLVPIKELSKIGKITGEIRMWLIMPSDEKNKMFEHDLPPLISYLLPQQYCDPRGIPIKEELKNQGLIDIKTGAYGTISAETSVIRKKRTIDKQRIMEFTGKSPARVYQLVLNILNTMAIEIYYHEDPREVTTLGRDGINQFHSILRGTKHIGTTPIYLDLIIEGDIFTVIEDKIAKSKTIKTRLKKVPIEKGNTKVTLRGVSIDLNVLNELIDEISASLKNQVKSII